MMGARAIAMLAGVELHAVMTSHASRPTATAMAALRTKTGVMVAPALARKVGVAITATLTSPATMRRIAVAMVQPRTKTGQTAAIASANLDGKVTVAMAR